MRLVGVNDNLHFPRIREEAFIRYKQVFHFHKRNACGQPVANAVGCVRIDLLLCISRAHSQLVQLNRSLRNVISFPTNFRARHFKLIPVLRYATSNLPRRYFLLDFAFFAARCIEARDVANEPTLLQAGKKDQYEIRIVHANVNKRRNTEFRWEAFRCAFPRCGRRMLHDTHRRKRSMLFDFRQSSSFKIDALFVKNSEILYPNWNFKIKNFTKTTTKSLRNL